MTQRTEWTTGVLECRARPTENAPAPVVAVELDHTYYNAITARRRAAGELEDFDDIFDALDQ